MLPAVATFKRTAPEILVYSVLLVATSLVLAAVAVSGRSTWCRPPCSGRSSSSWPSACWPGTPKAAMQLFSYSITYLTLLFVLMAVDVFTKH